MINQTILRNIAIIAHGLFNAQDRGNLFIGPQTKVYEGMIVGENSCGDDMVINVCKKKHVSNMRSSSADEALHLTPPKQMSLIFYVHFFNSSIVSNLLICPPAYLCGRVV